MSPGGKKRVEVRLEEVVARAEEFAGAPPPSPPSRAEGSNPAEPRLAVVPAADLGVFVGHIADAERRAAQAEARLQANEALLQFLRDRVAELQAQLEDGTAADLHRLAAEMRHLRTRAREQRDRGDAADAERGRVAYDAALICACAVVGRSIPYQLGDELSAAERTRLTQALREAGLDLGK